MLRLTLLLQMRRTSRKRPRTVTVRRQRTLPQQTRTYTRLGHFFHHPYFSATHALGRGPNCRLQMLPRRWPGHSRVVS